MSIVLTYKQSTTLTITSPNTQPIGFVTATAVLRKNDGSPVSGKVVVFSVGSISASGIPDANGVATAALALWSGQYTLNASFIGDAYYTPSNANQQILYAYQTTQFVIWGGNQPNLADAVKVGQDYMFWGAQWANQVTAGGFQANKSFKGYEDQVSGSSWTSNTANSGNLPASVARYISVIVSTQITKKGSVISGNITEVVVLQVDNPASYQPDPGHPGSGVIVAFVK